MMHSRLVLTQPIGADGHLWTPQFFYWDVRCGDLFIGCIVRFGTDEGMFFRWTIKEPCHRQGSQPTLDAAWDQFHHTWETLHD